MRKIIALVLSAVMMTVMMTTVFAAELGNGEVGGFTAADKPVTQEKNINLQKELTVYNLNEAKVHAPTITYEYNITAGPANVKVTDETTDHESEKAVTAYTREGVLAKLKVNEVEGTTGTIKWEASEEVDADPEGAPNYKTLNLDFSGVVFPAAGIYRYTVTETVPEYAASGVTETDNETNAHVRYLDVYVKPAATVSNNGNSAGDWEIYGYVCTLESEEITPDGDTAEKGAVKTNGFVSGKNDGTDYSADSYYTYNVTVSKKVANDAFAQATHAFPFTVLFTNAAITEEVDISSSTKGTVGGFSDPDVAALSAGNTKGILTLKHESSVKYIGIPAGTKVEVYETNDMSGTTYKVTTTRTNATTETGTDDMVISGNAPTSAVAQADPKANDQSTKTTVETVADENDGKDHVIAITNTLVTISPTGVVLRVAPYIMILAAGIILLLVSRRRKAVQD